MTSYENGVRVQAAIAWAWVSLRVVTRWLWPNGPSAEYPKDASPRFLSKVLSKRVTRVDVEDLAANRGLVGAMFKLMISCEDDGIPRPVQRLILKSTRNSRLVSSISRCAAREAIAYRWLGPRSVLLPKAYWSRMSFGTGECALLLEDVTARFGGGAVGINLLLGNQVWGIPNPLPRPVDPVTVITTVFLAAADLHASHWRDPSLHQQKRLKAVDWYAGRGRGGWEAGLSAAQRLWQGAKAGDAVKSGAVHFEPWMVVLMDASLQQASWDGLQARLRDASVPWTLTHGDWHASNLFWCYNDHMQMHSAAAAPVDAALDPRHVVAVDWSEIGVWEGPADLAQMMISDVPPPMRRACERDALRAYWRRLNERLPRGQVCDWDAVWAGYATRGCERWVWMFAVLAGYGLPPRATQYFHDQLAAFVSDHMSDAPADTEGGPRIRVAPIPVTSLVTIVI